MSDKKQTFLEDTIECLLIGCSIGLCLSVSTTLFLGLIGDMQNYIICTVISIILTRFYIWSLRWQYNRQQWLLRRKLLEEEWANVPNRALTLAGRTGTPQATYVSLSRADSSEEEKPRLSEGVEETTADDGQTVKS